MWCMGDRIAESIIQDHACEEEILRSGHLHGRNEQWRLERRLEDDGWREDLASGPHLRTPCLTVSLRSAYGTPGCPSRGLSHLHEAREHVCCFQASAGLFDTRVSGLLIHPHDDAHIYAGTPTGIWESKDAGEIYPSWTHIAATCALRGVCPSRLSQRQR